MKQSNENFQLPESIQEKIDLGFTAESDTSIAEYCAQSESHRQAVDLAIQLTETWDRQIRQSIDQIEIPDGLELRLKAAAAERGVVEAVELPLQEEWARDNEWDLNRGLDVAIQAAENVPANGNELTAEQRSKMKAVAHSASLRSGRKRRWVLSLASLACVVVIGAVSAGVFLHLERRPDVTLTELSRSSVDWLAQLEASNELEALPPESVASYPKCDDIDYEKLDGPGYRAIQTEFGMARGESWNVKRSVEAGAFVMASANPAPEKCFILTFPMNSWNFKYDLASKLPENPLPNAIRNHFVASSVDRTKGVVHVVMIRNESLYEYLLKPTWILDSSFRFHSDDQGWHRGNQLVAAGNLPESVIAVLEDFAKNN